MLRLLPDEDRFPVVAAVIVLWENLGQWQRAECLIRQTLVMVERLSTYVEEVGMWYTLAHLQDN